MAKPWTNVEEQKLIELYKTHTSRELAVALGRSNSAIQGKLKKLQAAGRLAGKTDARHWTAEDDAKLLTLSTKAAAKQLNRGFTACEKRKYLLNRKVKVGLNDTF